MAIAVGTPSNYYANPNGTSFTHAHTHPTGVDGLLVISLAMSNSVDISSITYGGQTLNILSNSNKAIALSIRVVQAYLKNPPTGSNNLVVTFNAPQYNFTCCYVNSFTGANININNELSTLAVSDPHAETMVGVSAGSYVYVRSTSGSTTQSIEIDGTSFTGGSLTPNNHNINAITSGALSNIIATAKDVNIVATCSGTASVIDSYEVMEAGTPTPPNNGNFLIFF